MEKAKELFYRYHGNRFYMDHDGVGWEYDSYHVSKEQEERWTEELLSGFLTSRPRGRDAIRAYSAVTDLIGRGKRREDWDACLYYPLRAGHLDDVTILFLLPDSLRMAERAVKKRQFSREEAESYRRELERYHRLALDRAEKGTMTRAEDFERREFSDPAVVAEHLEALEKKWDGLFR